MYEIILNILAIVRGNAICIVFGINYNFYIRIFSRVQIIKNKGAKILFGKGLMIGRNSSITVRPGGLLTIGEMSSLNADCKIVCQDYISIGKNTYFGPNVLVYDHDHYFDGDGVKRTDFVTRPISIGNNCWIGAGTIILKGTTIGDKCVIAAGSVVKGNIPSGTLYVQKRKESIINLLEHEK